MHTWTYNDRGLEKRSEYAEKALIETVMRPELDSAEFEIESSLCTSNSSQK